MLFIAMNMLIIQEAKQMISEMWYILKKRLIKDFICNRIIRSFHRSLVLYPMPAFSICCLIWDLSLNLCFMIGYNCRNKMQRRPWPNFFIGEFKQSKRRLNIFVWKLLPLHRKIHEFFRWDGFWHKMRKIIVLNRKCYDEG